MTPALKLVQDALLRGLSNKQICYDLGKSEGTVKVQIKALMRYYGATNRTQCALMSAGILPARTGVEPSR